MSAFDAAGAFRFVKIVAATITKTDTKPAIR
jgi:hypothetical protein